MDIEKFKKAEEIKANIKRLNGAIAEMDNMLSGDFSSFTHVVFSLWEVFLNNASQATALEFRDFIVGLRDKLRKEFEEL